MTVTLDALRLLPIPQSLAEYTELLAGTGIANPTTILGFQEPSGSILDLSGAGNSFAVTGTVAYQQAVASWASKAVMFTSGVDGMISHGFTSGRSLLVLAWVKFPATTSVNFESLVTLGADFGFGNEVAANFNNANKLICKDAGNHADGTVSVDGGVHLVLVQYDNTNHHAVVQTEIETMQPTFATASSAGRSRSTGIRQPRESCTPPCGRAQTPSST